MKEKIDFVLKCAELAGKKLTKKQMSSIMSADTETLQHTASYLMILAFGRAVDDMIETRKKARKSGGILDGIIADSTEDISSTARESLKAEYTAVFGGGL